MQLFLLLTISTFAYTRTTKEPQFNIVSDANGGTSVIGQVENSSIDDIANIGHPVQSHDMNGDSGKINHGSMSLNKEPGICEMYISPISVKYFRSRLQSTDPHLIRFHILFFDSKGNTMIYHATPDTFLPDQWVWTYWSPSGLYPYLSWNIDYSVLSFGLLDTKTLTKVRGAFTIRMRLQVKGACNITFGNKNTTKAIASALRDLTSQIVTEGKESNPEYDVSYYCYLAEAPGARNTIAYQAAVYFMFPISYINYNCCITIHDYTTNTFNITCPDEQIQKWTQCILGPFIIGIIVFLFYNPILMYKLAAWISNDEHIIPSDYEMMKSINTEEPAVLISHEGIIQDKDWIFMNGESPYKVTDLISGLWCGLNKRWPTAVSRARRLACVLLLPLGVYIKLLVYRYTMYDNVKLLLKHKTPMGFLSLLGEDGDRKQAFVTCFGGPVVILIIYYTVGFLFLVIPKSVKQIIEDGMPRSNANFRTPIILNVHEVQRLSMVNQHSEPGYMKAVALFICGMYMVFSKKFWVWVIQIQLDRVKFIDRNTTKYCSILKVFAMPFYFVICLLEVCIAVLVHGIPFVMFLCITLRGVTRSLISFRGHISQSNRNVIIRKLILNNPIVGMVIFTVTAVMVVSFAYTICLIFIDTFNFISGVLVYCFVAVIVFPSVAFGYLFFFVVLLYYIVRLIRDFDDSYVDLLSETVDISRNLDGHPNYVTFFGDEIIISNITVPIGNKRIRINDTSIDVTQNMFQNVTNENDQQKVKFENNMYAIPRDLFEYLVKKHRPAHQKLLKISMHIVFIVVLIWLTISISNKYVSGPSSEISEVMHVIFLVAVGALPRILEIAMTTASTHIKKEIELRCIEESIVHYWNGGSLDI